MVTMSMEVKYGSNVTCELCDKKFSVTILCNFSGHYCKRCITRVMPGVEAMYQKMVEIKARFTWYQRTFKLEILERIAYKRYRHDIRIEKTYDKEQGRLTKVIGDINKHFTKNKSVK